MVKKVIWLLHNHAAHDYHAYVPRSVRSFEDVLVKVHDQIDSAGDFHIEVTIQQEQQMAVMWHDPLVFR